MPYVNYTQTSSAKVSHLKNLEQWLDDNHTEISASVHEQLVEIYEEANKEAGNELRESENNIDELEERVKELQAEIEQLQEVHDALEDQLEEIQLNEEN
jgi:predicted  nucleic acid-binding Zn-ribbon protein